MAVGTVTTIGSFPVNIKGSDISQVVVKKCVWGGSDQSETTIHTPATGKRFALLGYNGGTANITDGAATLMGLSASNALSGVGSLIFAGIAADSPLKVTPGTTGQTEYFYLADFSQLRMTL